VASVTDPGGQAQPESTEPAPVADGTTGTTEDAQTQAETFDRDYVERLRRSEAGYRTRAQQTASELQQLQEELQGYRDAEMSAQELLERDLTEAMTAAEESQLEAAEANLRYEVARYGRDLDVVDYDAAVNLLDLEKVNWEGTRPTGVREALEALLQEKPFLRKAAAAPPVPNPGATAPGGQRPGTALTVEDIRRMSHAEINARYAEVQQVLMTQGRR